MRSNSYVALRILVGYLGEKAQFGWWSSSFLDANSKAFMQPSFPKTFHLAQYHGVLEAARRVHDEFIGVGRVYHLFRLPEEMEHALHDSFSVSKEENSWFESVQNQAMALEKLQALSKGSPGLGAGPITIGDDTALSSTDSVKKLAGAYLSAFNAGTRSYPYFKMK